MNISRPPLPVPSQQSRRKNLIQQPVIQRRSRSRSRQGSKQGVTLARDHSIRFDKQYQQKHMIIKLSPRLDSSKKTLKSPEQTSAHDKSTYVGNATTYNTLGEGMFSGHKPISSATYGVLGGQNDEIRSVTSLDLNHPRQVERMNGK